MGIPKVLNLTAPLARPDVEQETARIFEVCDGCRRCFNLCPSFNTLFDRIDAHDGKLELLTAADDERIAQECYYCKLCYNHCPYTPPHQFAIDFPRLMVGWKKLLAQEGRARWRDRLLVRTDWIGKVGTWLAPLANWAAATAWVRVIMERVLGIHRNRQLVAFERETFPQWFARRREDRSRRLMLGKAEVGVGGASGTRSAGVGPPPTLKVALFSTCLVDYHTAGVGRATVVVLERNGVEIIRPAQECCGMPFFDTGDIQPILKKIQTNVAALKPWVEQGYDVIAPSPSCSLMLKREYPHLLPREDVKLVAARTFDVCEYLMKLKKQGRLDTNFSHRPGRIAYQIPCHLRDQNIGFKSKEAMELTGASVEVIERCSGHDGTWGAKVEFFDLSMKIAAKAVRELDAAGADLVVSDCPLAGLQLTQAMGGKPTLHPIEVIQQAYGL